MCKPGTFPFPARLDPKQTCVVSGRYSGESAHVRVRVNHIPVGKAEVLDGRFSFSFPPSGLGAGIHLLDVVGENDRAFAAARLEVARTKE